MSGNGRPSVVIRCDASLRIGSGHIMRCLTLADQLARQGATISFLCRDLPGQLGGVIAQRGYRATMLPPPEATPSSSGAPECWLGVPPGRDAGETAALLRELRPDWLIVDHYGLDETWETQLRPLVGRIMVIDDLADRRHDCDLLLDQNYCRDGANRYAGLVPEQCRLFLGPRFALLREEFYTARQALAERDGTIRRLFIFFGGADDTGETAKAIAALADRTEGEILADVVVGAANRQRAALEEQCARLPGVTYHCQTPDIARLMAAADFAFGAGGTATWERCFLGLPAAATVLARNQLAVVEAVAAYGALHNLGWHNEVTGDRLATELAWAVHNPAAVREMGRRALALMGDATRRDNPLVAALCK